VHHANHRRSIRNHGRPQRHRGEPEEEHLEEAEGRQGAYLLATSREVRISLLYIHVYCTHRDRVARILEEKKGRQREREREGGGREDWRSCGFNGGARFPRTASTRKTIT